MNDFEQSKRSKEQRRALSLDVASDQGALIVNKHLNRKQEVIGVTKTDLEDILQFDSLTSIFWTVGMFLVSGAGWLAVENALSENGFVWNTLMATCVVSTFSGFVFLLAGFFCIDVSAAGFQGSSKKQQ